MKDTICAVAVIAGLGMGSAVQAEIQWRTENEFANRADGDAILYFRMNSSALCKEVEEDIWTNSEVADLAGTYAAYRIDATSTLGAKLAKDHSVVWVPTTVLFTMGKEAARLERSVDRKDYLSLLRGEPIPTPVNVGTEAGEATTIRADDSTGEVSTPSLDIKRIFVQNKSDELGVAMELSGPPTQDWLGSYSIYIDADGDSGTGYAGGKYSGADYLVQGITVFTFSGTNRMAWEWQQSGMGRSTVKGNTLILTVSPGQVGLSHDEGFLLWAGTQTRDWQDADWAPDSSRIQVGKVAQNLDASAGLQATSANAQVVKDSSGEAAGPEDIRAVAIRDLGSSLEFRLETAQPPNPSGLHIFINADGDESTGYGDSMRAGADFMVEGEKMYRFAGDGPAVWNWKELSPVAMKTVGTAGIYTIEKSRIGAGAGTPVKMWFMTTGSDWNPADYAPDTGAITYEE